MRWFLGGGGAELQKKAGEEKKLNIKKIAEILWCLLYNDYDAVLMVGGGGQGALAYCWRRFGWNGLLLTGGLWVVIVFLLYMARSRDHGASGFAFGI